MVDFDPAAAAAFIAKAHRERDNYTNLSGNLQPPDISQAYDAQEHLCKLWEPVYGPVAGLKIATTTKVMQALMGIDHPCGGIIYASRIHQSPAALASSDFIHPMIECELAVKLGAGLPDIGEAYDAAAVRSAVSEVMAAFEIIEDRNADYKETDARSLIADNAWNGGIVIGPAKPVAGDLELDGVAGRLVVNGTVRDQGPTDDPMGALAWVANLAVERGRPLTAGMVVITGSVVATLGISPGERFNFELEGIGAVELSLDQTA